MAISETISNALSFLNGKIITPQMFFVLGSGIDISEILQDCAQVCEFKANDIPDYPKPSVVGHSGKIAFGVYQNILPIAIVFGRKHLYEGDDYEPCFISHLMGKLGARMGIFTSSTGGIDMQIVPGDLIILTDIINAQGAHLRGYNSIFAHDSNAEIERNVIAETYNNEITKQLIIAAENANIYVRKGVFAAVTGPNYETHAEVFWLRKIGASVVSMSMAPEIAIARAYDIKCGGMSLVANVCGAQTNHEEVLHAAQVASRKLVLVIREFLKMQIHTDI